jgi:hypothetical protein
MPSGAAKSSASRWARSPTANATGSPGIDAPTLRQHLDMTKGAVASPIILVHSFPGRLNSYPSRPVSHLISTWPTIISIGLRRGMPFSGRIETFATDAQGMHCGARQEPQDNRTVSPLDGGESSVYRSYQRQHYKRIRRQWIALMGLTHQRRRQSCTVPLAASLTPSTPASVHTAGML